MNQQLEIVNDDQTSHNIHPLPKSIVSGTSRSLQGRPPIIEKYDKPEFIPVKCNIHPWMHGDFAVLKNSHYAITSGDGTSSFRICRRASTRLLRGMKQYGDADAGRHHHRQRNQRP